MSIWATIEANERITSHSGFREISDAEFQGDTCFMSGITVWDVDHDSDGINTCSLIGLRMDGVMIHPDLLEAIAGKAEVARHHAAALERFQGEIDAGEWGGCAA